MTPKKAMARNIMKTLVASTVDLRTSYLNLGFYLKCKPPAKIFGEWVNIAWKRHRKICGLLALRGIAVRRAGFLSGCTTSHSCICLERRCESSSRRKTAIPETWRAGGRMTAALLRRNLQRQQKSDISQCDSNTREHFKRRRRVLTYCYSSTSITARIHG
jgi:hypothetical protein